MKLLKRHIAAIVLLILMLPTLLVWLVGSASGVRWLLKLLTPADTLQIDVIEGNLLGGLRMAGVRYHDDKMKITLDEALLGWHPSELWHKEVRVEMFYLTRLHVEQLTRDDTPLQLPDIHLPLTLRLDDVQINDLAIVPLQQPPVHISNASFRAIANHDEVKIQYLDVNSDALQLTISGTLQPYKDYSHNLEIQWQLQLEDLPLFNGSGKLTGDLRQTALHHQLALPAKLEADLTLLDLLQKPHWQAQLKLPLQPLNTVDKDWPTTKVALTARGSGDLERATVDAFTLDALNSRVQGKGKLNWKKGLQWQADVDSKAFDLAALWKVLDVTGPNITTGVKGKLSGDLDKLNATAVTLKALDGEINGTAFVNWHEQLQWQTQLQATHLALEQFWPLLNMEGPKGVADLATTLSGDANGMEVTQLSFQSLGANVNGSGQLLWSPQLRWQTSLTGEGLDPSAWWPQQLTEWKGNLNTQLHSQGRVVNKQVHGTLTVQRLDGVLRDYPVQLKTELALANQQLEIKRFSLHSAGSKIEIQGTADDEVQLQWHLDSPQLTQLYPAAQGRLKIDGQLNGPRKEPLLQLALEGKDLAYAGQEIGALKGDAKIQLFNWQQLSLALHAQQLQLAGQEIDAVEINTQGTTTDHQLQLHLKMAEVETTWRLNGAYDIARQQWHGEINQADLNTPDFGQWPLMNAATLSVSRNQLQLAPLCWQQQTARLCMSGERQHDMWQGSLEASHLDLTLLSPWLPEDLEINGEATLNASLRYRTDSRLPQPLSAEADISLGAGYLSYPIIEGERSEWRFAGGHWEGKLDERGLRSRFDLAMMGEDQIKADIELPGFNPLTSELDQQPVRGNVHATVSDLGLVNNLLFEVQGLKGKIELDTEIGGMLIRPTLTGQVQLRDGSLQIPRLGLSLSDAQFTARSVGTREVTYHLKVRSGDGAIEANGQTLLSADEGWPTHLTLTGERFEISHIPEARVVINPNLELKTAHRELWLTGEILILEARLQPKEIITTATVSDDVVIVGAAEPTQTPWKIHNRVRLILGDRVSLYGFGFEGTIGGNLLLIDEPGQPTAATGELNVIEGRYRAYGQRLDIEQGKLLFAGGPITNPALDLRAVRRIQEITAGIKVYGPLRQPQFELFSVPVMGQTDALAYLILGAPLEQTTSTKEGAIMAQAALAFGLKGGDLIARSIGNRFGIEDVRIESTTSGDQASLIMGRYLSPRLYVGYGVGLIDAANTVNLRYQLSQHWQLKAESGASQGADIIYTIER